mmetsp:Transcript_34086/g.72767  ORF Transcript_34086/g.72767 Transcript_34086/m.72767 type:complete len:105 (-) Transcript_34086:1245-1559(-)
MVGKPDAAALSAERMTCGEVYNGETAAHHAVESKLEALQPASELAPHLLAKDSGGGNSVAERLALLSALLAAFAEASATNALLCASRAAGAAGCDALRRVHAYG